MKLTYFISLVFFTAFNAFGQSHEYSGYITPISELFDIENGNFHDIEEDWNGFMWMATNDGLYRFDGTTVKNYIRSKADTLLPHNQVLDILVDSENKELWLGTALGLCRLDPALETSRIYQSKFGDSTTISDNIVRYVYKDRSGQIWASSFTQGISLYQPETDDFKNYHFTVPGVDSIQKIDPTINESRLNSHRFIVQDNLNDDILWLGSPLGLVSFNKKTETFNWAWAKHPQLTSLFPNNSVNVIYPLEGKLVVGTLDKALMYDVKKGRIEFIIPPEHAKKLKNVTHISRRSDDELWISYTNGLAAFDVKKKEVTGAWVDNKALKKRYGIRCIDSEDRVWINSSGSTVMYDPQKQVAQNYLLPDAYEHRSIMMRKLGEKELVLLTDKPQFCQIFDLETLTWKTITMYSSTINWEEINWQDIVKVDEKTWVLIDEKDVYQLDLETNQLSSFGIDLKIEKPRLTTAIVDDQNNLWLASIRVGLFKINLKTKDYIQYVDELNSPYSTSLYTWIEDLHKDKMGNIWIRLARSYAIYNPKEDKFNVFSYSELGNKTFRYIENFTADKDGDIWISSLDLGFGRTDANHLEKGVVEKITIQDGLLSTKIADMQFDKNNLLWVLTNKGISTFSPDTRVIKNYTWHRGIPKAKRLIPLNNGKVAMQLNIGGLALLDPDLVLAEQIIPKPYFSGVTVKGNIDHDMGNRIALERLSVGSRDYVAFNFSAMGYSNPKEFAYKLVGVDKDWVQTKDNKSTSYSNLIPGNYTLLLKSRLEGSTWSPVKELSVYLRPKWFETWWFRTIALATLFFLAYRIYLWRLEGARQKERLKAEFQRKLDEVEMQALRSQMNPHFFFNSLNSIQLYIIKNEPKTAVEYLDRFSRLMRLILQNSRAKTVPLKDELEALELYMALESLRFTVSFDQKIEVDPDININDIEIPPMLLQPFVENAIWHGIQHKGEKGEILIKIDLDDEFLDCVIQDDGIGRERAKNLRRRSLKHHKSMGMKITQDRLDMLNQTQNGRVGSIKIIDLYDDKKAPCGTKVLIRLPII